MFVGLFSLGILLLSKVATFQDLSHVLFGNILGVSRGDVWAMVAVVVIVLLSVVLFYKELLVTSFDPSHAVAIGLNPNAIRYGLLAAVAVTTVIAVQTVGVVLVLALLITPAAAASLLSRRLSKIMVLSVVFGVVSTVVGFYGSYYLDVASGPAVVLTLTIVFVFAWAFGRVVGRAAVREPTPR
jgi:ABC-type Mn2+/Zn2+ transport system permease subunit